MTEEIPGIENAAWLERRLERRPTPPASKKESPAPRSAVVASSPPAPSPPAPAVQPRKAPSPVPQRPALARKRQPQAPSPNVLWPAGASTAAPPPAARLLHATPLVAAPGGSTFSPNFALRLAQLVVVAQSVTALITGSNLVRGAAPLVRIGSGVNLPATSSLASHYGVGIMVVGGLLLIGAFVVTVPSQIARTLLVVMEVLALGLSLAAHFGGGSVLGFATVIGMGATGSALLPFGAAVSLQSAVIYLLAIHPPTYRAFAR